MKVVWLYIQWTYYRLHNLILAYQLRKIRKMNARLEMKIAALGYDQEDN